MAYSSYVESQLCLWERENPIPTPSCWGFPDGLEGKESTCSAGDLGSVPG